MTRDEALYLRGAAPLLASWDEYARDRAMQADLERRVPRPGHVAAGMPR